MPYKIKRTDRDIERTFNVSEPAALITPKEHKFVKKPKQPAPRNKCGCPLIIPHASFSTISLNSKHALAMKRKNNEAGDMKYNPSHIEKLLLANKNCIQADFAASDISATNMHKNPIF